MDLTGIINLLLSKGVPFAGYSMPGQQKVCFAIQTGGGVNEVETDNLDDISGFAVAPFSSYYTKKLYLISPHIVFCQNDFEKVKDKIENIESVGIKYGAQNKVVSKENYLQQAQKIVSLLQTGSAKKVVLSRYFTAGFDKRQTPALFESLHKSYPDAFVYLMYIPQAGLWCGATPETLLTLKDNRFETMALAGTQLYSGNLSWQNKEIEEQQYVVNFVETVLKKANITDYKKLPRKTVRAGKLAHLQTLFQIPAETLKGKTGKIVGLLHPTPAVGGLPQKEACEIIRETEIHNRRLYTGFLGPWNINGNSGLFVNLRCAEIHDNKIGLYVGGGITAASQPAKEWDETVNKSKTLLAIVEKLRTFAP